MDVEESGRGLIQVFIPEFAWRDCGRPRKALVRIVCPRADI
jgi:hypothetical protein